MKKLKRFLLKIAKESQSLALNYREEFLLNKNVKTKKDDSIVTEADISISKYLQSNIKAYMKKNKEEDYIYLDEELTSNSSLSIIDNSEYTWIIDPIDGTLNYACGLNTYAISISLFKKGKPYAAIIMLPSRNEIYMSIKDKFYFYDLTFNRNRNFAYKHAKITEQTKNNFYIFSSFFFTKNNKIDRGALITSRSSVINGLTTIDGSSLASIERVCIWDNAAIFVLAKSVGIKFFNLETGKEIKKFKSKYFENSDIKRWFWKFETILIKKKNLSLVKNLIKRNK